MDEIVNKVAGSGLITIDLEEFYPKNPMHVIDIAPWLIEGVLLREKEFRAHLRSQDWQVYQDSLVAINCSTDAILPAWAFPLVSLHLAPVADLVVQGNTKDLLAAYYRRFIDQMDTEVYNDARVLLKGCAKKEIPQDVFVALSQKLYGVVKSLMFGEACSTVPMYKKQ